MKQTSDAEHSAAISKRDVFISVPQDSPLGSPQLNLVDLDDYPWNPMAGRSIQSHIHCDGDGKRCTMGYTGQRTLFRHCRTTRICNGLAIQRPNSHSHCIGRVVVKNPVEDVVKTNIFLGARDACGRVASGGVGSPNIGTDFRLVSHQ